EIGVLVVLVRVVDERCLDDRLTRLVGAARDAPEVATGGQAGPVLEQKPERNEVLLATGEFGNVLRDRIVEMDLSLIEEDHQGSGRTDDLGQRRKVVDALRGIDAFAFVCPVEPAEALLPNGGAFAPNDDGSAG